ncbi:MAG: MFS transporter, partial [Actinomycetes bacterium]
AALPLLAGLPPDVTGNPAALDTGYDTAMLISAGMFVLGGLVAWLGVPRPAATAPAARYSWTATCPQLETPPT